MSRIHFRDLAALLKRFPRYSAVEVFASDIQEVLDAEASKRWPEGVKQLETSSAFSVDVDGAPYRFEILPNGVVRFSKAGSPATASNAALVGALVGGAIGASNSKKGDGAIAGMLLGLLVGKMLEPRSTDRVFTVRFDGESRDWVAYDGGLVNWLKTNMPLATG